MENRITVLPREIADKIAAGEVIERPASIVKELLENALDAGARDIDMVLEEGGKGSIRITDNGGGIDSRDVKLAFERHATSKIRHLDDIFRIGSFGFRGEALPSIAAVSDMEMLTRRRGDLSGVRVSIQAGKIKEVSAAGCPEGTTIVVRNIFGTLPARRKFLKRDALEQRYCLDVITRLALAHPEIRMKVSSGNKTILNVPRAKDLSERIALVLGMEFGSRLLPLEGMKDGLTVRGFISRPDFTRSSPRDMYFYVNRRSVRDHLISHAVMNAYRGAIEARQYPATVLFLEMGPEAVDVNVHPAKTEVRFRDSKQVYETVLETIAAALSAEAFRPGASPSPKMTDAIASRIAERSQRYFVSTGQAKPLFTPDLLASERSRPIAFSSPPVERDGQDAGGFFSTLRYLGQIGGTYLVLTGEEGMVLIDQHAAHERILYERLKESAASGRPVERQVLLMPEVITLNPAESALLRDCQEILIESGMDLSQLDGDTAVIKSMPRFVRGDASAVIKDILAELADLGKAHSLEQVRDKIFASMACKGAIKANDGITEPEVAQLCRDLDRIPHASTCPHGRPVYIRFSYADLEKMFKRRT